MGTVRGVGLAAAAISIALHLAAAAAFLRRSDAGPAPASSIEVWLAPAQPAPARPRPAPVADVAPARGRATAATSRAPAVASPPAGAAAAPPPPAIPAGPAPPAAPASPREVAQSPQRADGFDAYAELVWTRVDRARPTSGARSVAAEVAFDLDRDGRLTRLRLVSSSGIPDFDRAAMRAVRAAAPFPRPPADIDPARLQFRILIRSPAA